MEEGWPRKFSATWNVLLHYLDEACLSSFHGAKISHQGLRRVLGKDGLTVNSGRASC